MPDRSVVIVALVTVYVGFVLKLVGLIAYSGWKLFTERRSAAKEK
jgi:hypothetical protein